MIDWFTGDDFHHNGCFFLAHAFNFMSGFGKVVLALPLQVELEEREFDLLAVIFRGFAAETGVAQTLAGAA